MTECLICNHPLTIESLSCEKCKMSYNGTFHFPRLARLSKEEQKLAELLVLHGGNLKTMAETLEVSYPTLKKKLNKLSTSLKNKQQEDEHYIEDILHAIESKEMSAEEGIKLIREINGEL